MQIHYKKNNTVLFILSKKGLLLFSFWYNKSNLKRNEDNQIEIFH